MSDAGVDVWLSVLDALPFDTLPPFRELRLFVGQERPLLPEDVVVEPGHSRLRFSSRRAQNAADVMKTGAMGRQGQDLDVLVALLLATMLARDREAGARQSLAGLVDHPDGARTSVRVASEMLTDQDATVIPGTWIACKLECIGLSMEIVAAFSLDLVATDTTRDRDRPWRLSAASRPRHAPRRRASSEPVRSRSSRSRDHRSS